MTNLLSNRRRLPTLLFVVLLVCLAGVACGSEGGAESGVTDTFGGQVDTEFQKVIDSDRIFTVDDLLAAGFKKGKTYNVEGLEKATAVIYGFYGLDPYKRQEYEIRFYESHSDAVQYGMPMADETTGEDAQLKAEDATWDEGLRERRECQGSKQHSHHSHLCLQAKHADYAVRGNMILLCQGKDVSVSIEHCGVLLEAMGLQ